MRITGAYRGDERFPHCRVHPHLCLIEQLVASRWIVRVLCQSQAISRNFVVTLCVRSRDIYLVPERRIGPNGVSIPFAWSGAGRSNKACLDPWCGRVPALGGDLDRDPAVLERDSSANHDRRMHRTAGRDLGKPLPVSDHFQRTAQRAEGVLSRVERQNEADPSKRTD